MCSTVWTKTAFPVDGYPAPSSSWRQFPPDRENTAGGEYQCLVCRRQKQYYPDSMDHCQVACPGTACPMMTSCSLKIFHQPYWHVAPGSKWDDLLHAVRYDYKGPDLVAWKAHTAKPCPQRFHIWASSQALAGFKKAWFHKGAFIRPSVPCKGSEGRAYGIIRIGLQTVCLLQDEKGISTKTSVPPSCPGLGELK